MDAKRRRPAAAREVIIRAATELIRVNGVSGTSISDVIAASGTSAGAIYHHFGNKERLVLEVARSAMAVPMSMILQTSTGLSPAALFSAALDRVSEEEGIAEMLLQVWAGAKANEVLQQLLLGEVATVKASIVEFIAGWCAEHAPGTDPAALASVIMGLITGYAVQRGLGIQIDTAAYRELGVRLLSAAVVTSAGS